MDAERALVHIPLGVYIPCSVGTGGDTGLAADALIFVHQHNAFLGYPARARRAHLHARCIRTMVAALGADLHEEMGIVSAELLLHPVPEMIERDLVLVLACYDTGIAADAFYRIHGHDISFPAHITPLVRS